MSIDIVLTQMIIILILMALGYLLMHRGIVNNQGIKQISFIVANICNPAILLTSAFSEDNQASNSEVLMVAVVAFLVFLFLMLLGNMMGPILRAPKDERRYYCLMTMFGNTGFIGIPLTTAILGPSCLIYIAVFNFMFNMFIYTYGIFLLNKQAGTKKRVNWRVFVNPGTVASVLTVIIFLFKIPVPTVAAQSLTYMGNATTFLAIFVIGTSMAQLPFWDIVKERRLYFFIALRYVGLPILITFIMKQISDDILVVGTTVLMTAVPVANMPLMMAKEKELDTKLLAQGIILSTILSVVTIPIVAMFV